MNRRSVVSVIGLAVAASALLYWQPWLTAHDAPDRAPGDARGDLAARTGGGALPKSASYVGREACAACHARETKLWMGSHHDLAMQEANEETVLGDFGGAQFDYHGVISTFTKREGRCYVTTDGPDGALHEYPIAYTFGVDPLQQYLIAFPDGRIQALNVSWDTRPKELGGQRWFHLYPHENVAFDDVLHWTGPYQNWNHMCAECHSTNVHRNYDALQDTFKTTWSEIDVSCEACHGPASAHVAWAEAVRRGEKIALGDAGVDASGAPRASGKGLVASLREFTPGKWVMDTTTGIARRDRPRTSNDEIEACARCHARRSQLAEDWLPGRPLADTHRPALLDSLLYEDDGEIKDEVYEYGSFLQSKMHAAGVTCTDCHDPHSLELPPDNSICARCHSSERFDAPAHHHHAQGGQGARCIACHMPMRDYMVVHTRHDHSFRVPRPDLSVELGTPNTCTSCHTDHPASWAADAAAKWWKKKPGADAAYAEALHLGRRNLPGASAALAKLAADAAQPGIVRATALELLGEHLDPAAGQALTSALSDADPLVRLGAATALHDAPPEVRARYLPKLARDPVRSVRIEVGRALAGAPMMQIDPGEREAATNALSEWRAVQALTADRAESHLNLGALAAEYGDLDTAERQYRVALKLSPRFPATYINLADVFRERQKDAAAERVLREGLKIAPRDPNILSALGLALVRQQRSTEALPLLEQAASLAPDDPHHAYVYAVALSSLGQAERALAILAAAHGRHPGDREVLLALALYSRDAKAFTAALEYARKLLALDPNDPDARALLTELEKSGR
jgi:Flp pilus assembly protein TadD